MKTVIFDIDGTLADLTHRLHHVKNGNRRWDQFFAECDKDAVIEPIADLCRMLFDGYTKIVLVSGRSESTRVETEKWMVQHNIRFYELHMRPVGDFRKDHILKEEILDKLLAAGHDIAFVVDDRPSVVAMWRRRGLTCLQCADWVENQGEKPKQFGLLTLMVGPSGAGKSTLLDYRCVTEATVTPLFKPSLHFSHIISSDRIRQDLCGDFRDQSKNDAVFAAVHALAKTRINHGLPVVIDATNIRRADRMACVALAEGNPVRYIVIDRPMEEKRRDGGWRNELEIDLLAKHQQTFDSNLKDILKGDSQSNVTVIDMRRGK